MNQLPKGVFMFQRLAALSMVLFMCSCATVPLKPVTYSGKEPLFPAVVAAFTEKRVKLETIDIFSEEFKSDYLYGYDLLIKIRFKLLVKKNNGTIETTLVDMQKQDSQSSVWKDDEFLLAFNRNKFANGISGRIAEVMNNPKQYETLKKKTLADFSFNYLVLKDLTSVGRKRWVKKYMKGRVYQLDLALHDFEKNTTNSKKKYVADFFSESTQLYPEYHINLFTNNDRYASMKKGTKVATKGRLSNLESALFGDTFYVSLIEM